MPAARDCSRGDPGPLFSAVRPPAKEGRLFNPARPAHQAARRPPPQLLVLAAGSVPVAHTFRLASSAPRRGLPTGGLTTPQFARPPSSATPPSRLPPTQTRFPRPLRPTARVCMEYGRRRPRTVTRPAARFHLPAPSRPGARGSSANPGFPSGCGPPSRCSGASGYPSLRDRVPGTWWLRLPRLTTTPPTDLGPDLMSRPRDPLHRASVSRRFRSPRFAARPRVDGVPRSAFRARRVSSFVFVRERTSVWHLAPP